MSYFFFFVIKASGKIVRGVTCGIATMKKRHAIACETGDASAKIPATLDEHMPKIVYGGEMSFSTQAGIALREKCPFDVHKWANVPASAKNAMYQFLAVRILLTSYLINFVYLKTIVK